MSDVEIDRKRDRAMRESIGHEIEYRLKLCQGENDARQDLYLALMMLKSDIRIEYISSTACTYILPNGRPVLSINPNFWNRIKLANGKPDRAMRFSLLVHELFHLMFGHFSRFDKPGHNRDRETLNIALDCAINQRIDDLSRAGAVVANVPAINYYNFHKFVKNKSLTIKEHESAEYYYALLKKSYDEDHGQDVTNDCSDGEGESQSGQDKGQGKAGQGESQDGKGQGDRVYVQDHGQHFENNQKAGEAQNTELARELFKQLMVKTMSQAGCTPQDFGLDLDEQKEINWRQLFRMFLSKNARADLRRIRTRKSKRFGWKTAKRVKNKIAEVDVLIDTSGSMAGDLPIVFAELASLATAQKTHFNVYTADTRLYDLGKIRGRAGVKELAKDKIKGGGGTDFTQALVELGKINKRKKPIIFITDTYGAFPEPVNYEMIILCTEKNVYSGMPDWARRISMDISDVMEKAHAKENAA